MALSTEYVSSKPIKEKPEHYISGPQFMSDISEYYKWDGLKENLDEEDNSVEAKEIRKTAKKYFEKCGMAINMMITGLAKNPKFSGYTWKDEMIADALVKCTKALIGKKFDPTRKYNPFSYFNRIAWREFLRRINLEKTNVKIKNEYGQEFLRAFAKENTDTPIYIMPVFASSLGEFYNAENEIVIEDYDE
jgi:hypothetical protein